MVLSQMMFINSVMFSAFAAFVSAFPPSWLEEPKDVVRSWLVMSGMFIVLGLIALVAGH